MLLGHKIKSWSSAHPVIVLSSEEAALYALVKAATQAKGLGSLLGDYGHNTVATPQRQWALCIEKTLEQQDM